jgi:hypothetical protein
VPPTSPVVVHGSATAERGFHVLPGTFASPHEALALARAEADEVRLRSAAGTALPPLDVVAHYVMPTPEAPGRPFQPLHMDFGIPLGKVEVVDVAAYTLLFLDPGVAPSGAATRIILLRDLGRQRRWPSAPELATRLLDREDDADLAEGVLARIVEAADRTSTLPRKSDPSFRCGLEFDSIDEETAFFSEHGLDLPAVEVRVALQPGQALLFDNLRCAHGRLGQRTVGELHQLCLGYPALPTAAQRAVLLHSLRQLTDPDD